jgi:hypothetical protein
MSAKKVPGKSQQPEAIPEGAKWAFCTPELAEKYRRTKKPDAKMYLIGIPRELNLLRSTEEKKVTGQPNVDREFFYFVATSNSNAIYSVMMSLGATAEVFDPQKMEKRRGAVRATVRTMSIEDQKKIAMEVLKNLSAKDKKAMLEEA